MNYKQQIQSYVDSLADGQDVADELIEALQPLAQQVANGLTRSNGQFRFRDDAYSEAMFHCNVVVKRLASEPEYLSKISVAEAFFYVLIRRHVARWLTRQCNPENVPSDGRSDLHVDSAIGRSSEKAQQMLTEILDLTQNKTERQVIQLRSESYSDREIAEQTGLARETVRDTRKRVQQRYEGYSLAT